MPILHQVKVKSGGLFVAKLMGLLKTNVAGEEGQALVEYGLILALVALVAVVGVAAMGSDVGGMYEIVKGIATAMSDAISGAG
jgi:Flp pilus assembly pilin Flp